ncbi:MULTISPECIES: glutamine-hydrolyzing carbamoyl-phosphate synthase small subunit [unclassified Marivivens]|mgnify:CR=1 FL=1|jgi:carbamoyl-phosphate synthase small subunit|uniref:glutamine-hydrolyzing carbamoyl-phosphate synthase small subunit n=1 Tax=Marivivens TaxID=1759396 RepID=UPI0007FFF125|nr:MULTISPECIES: glutamine-hydrolyzing carbamoyl-phosphate synthase small subunit [unclassified Marivivens]MCL7406379.1 glutamine-hydrolyzing carbamoyl-phosphate synthase small subunit [Marivivens geojensis]OBR35810.1 carbamoyl phosphate synthase small subunit [Donghicola sp. JL3646]APO87295.1 carbamoyl phosphate synthase small subunit [Marivivens sp. JLT3646]NBQ49971.1 carbamoyl-phosphate synthase small subunit [Marivivens sp.]NBX08882.1 carbamoyl-phosphate synthase small subunit [Marivivens 
MPNGTAQKPTACLALADGTLFYGKGFGATGQTTAELCFNTAMTGYQEIMTDPSYAGQIVTFTFPHIGNTGVTEEDDETADPVSAGMVVKWDPTEPSNWRATEELTAWLTKKGRIGIGGIDTRRLTRAIRQQGAPHVALAHDPEGNFDAEALVAAARGFKGLVGLDLAKDVTCAQSYKWNEMRWAWPDGYQPNTAPKHKVVAVDYGAKRNILRCLASAGCDVTVLPATATAEDVLSHNPDGVFLSNGPGDPAATGEYAVPMIKQVLDTTDLPVFGICLGHQMLALALGAKTVKMNHGHHGANHPVKDKDTGKVEITSMNHGFTVDSQTLPEGVVETHISLFDGSNCGIRMADRPVFSVQHHPEASPGPQDSFYLFERFADAMEARKA